MDWVRPIVNSWLSVIHKASSFKDAEFGQDAEESMRFFDGPHDFMYTGKYATKEGALSLGAEDSLPSPTFRMTFNKVAEAVQLFGPALYHRNPYRMVNPATLPDIPLEFVQAQAGPQAQQVMQQLQMQRMQKQSSTDLLSSLLAYYLNYTPNELDLRAHSRQAIDETLIKGMGLLWQEVYRPPGSNIRMVGSFYDTVDNLLIDPDMESMDHAKWIARRRVLPRWEVERRFKLKPGTIRGNIESYSMQSQAAAFSDYSYFHQRGDTNDLLTYWEVYSRMGFGHRLATGLSNQYQEGPLEKTLDKFGSYVYLAICDTHPFPLNLPESIIKRGSTREAFLKTQWPTPFWADPADPWPFTQIAFHRRPRKVWPMSHIKPAMGEIKFINWALSFMADKVKNTSRDFIAIQKSAGEELRTSILSGRDLTLLEIESQYGTIDKVVSFLQHPQFNGDIYKVIEIMMSLLERRLGLNELMYGESSRQLRSAQEAQIKGDQLRIRPDDMAEQVETAMTKAARKEALCCRWHLEPEDVAPILGEDRAKLWEQYVQNADITQVVMELDYRIEAGSIRKPNRDRDRANATNAVQVWAPLYQQYFQMTGDVQPINGLISNWAKANDIEPGPMLLQPPPPPQPDPGEQQKAQLEQQKAQLEMQMKQAELQIEQIKAKQDMDIGAAEHQQEMAQDQQEHVQEIMQDRERHILEMLQARQAGQLDLLLAKQKAAADVEATRARAAAAAKAKPASSNSNGKSKSNA